MQAFPHFFASRHAPIVPGSVRDCVAEYLDKASSLKSRVDVVVNPCHSRLWRALLRDALYSHLFIVPGNSEGNAVECQALLSRYRSPVVVGFSGAHE